MTSAKLRLAMAAMGKPQTNVGSLCKELGVTRSTLYRHVSPKGEPRGDAMRLLKKSWLLRLSEATTAAKAGFEDFIR